jgi:hypothetical protein
VSGGWSPWWKCPICEGDTTGSNGIPCRCKSGRVSASPGCGYSGCNAPTYHAAEGCPSRPQTIALASLTPEQQEIARLRGALREVRACLGRYFMTSGYEEIEAVERADRLAAKALGEEEG